MELRDAAPEDMEGVATIYNDAVLNSTATWNERTVDADNRRAWLADRQHAGYPVLVTMMDGVVAGYASFGDWRAFDGYRHTVEHAVYVHPDFRGRKIGEGLLLALISRAEAMGKHVMVAAIEAENAGSIRLHEKMGFTRAGHLREVGRKFGRWLDLVLMERRLG